MFDYSRSACITLFAPYLADTCMRSWCQYVPALCTQWLALLRGALSQGSNQTPAPRVASYFLDYLRARALCSFQPLLSAYDMFCISDHSMWYGLCTPSFLQIRCLGFIVFGLDVLSFSIALRVRVEIELSLLVRFTGVKFRLFGRWTLFGAAAFFAGSVDSHHASLNAMDYCSAHPFFISFKLIIKIELLSK